MENVDEKKLRTMNEVPASEAVQWFDDMSDDPEGYWTTPPSWFAEVNAKDFMDCWKLYSECRVRENISGWELQPLTEQQREEINAIPDEILKRTVSKAEYPVIKLALQGKTVKEIAHELGKKPKTINTQLKSAVTKLKAAGYKVTVPTALTPDHSKA